ncbi:MAG TPA: hypothetical protein VGV37_13615 [Aliidongia sp.]|uniref:endonuclease toxin domain-containing protein n=1 Tax=Aliidongia sp. TaxID=1914230 RepID=UPI002DDD3779|nr:hypothetical protein [Aliidongia sp.]HEV2675576.1 hypothetical protein [Aliidongia sp.]
MLNSGEGGFFSRSPSEIRWLLAEAYQSPPDVTALKAGLDTVARALNNGQIARAMIAAVLLKLPELDWAGAVRIARTEDVLTKYNPDEPRDWHGRWTEDAPLILPPGRRIDELGDILEWIANARPEDAPIIRSEIKRYYYDVGDVRGGNALNEALSNVVYGEPTRAERQDVLDTFEMYTRADPAEIAQIGRDLLVMGLSLPLEAAAETAEVTAPNVWKMGWAARGLHIEKLLGGNLPPGFRVIDRFANGIATSIKSIDLTAASYQNAARLTARLNRYVDRVARFEGDELGSTVIGADEISGRALHLGIPDGSLTNVQRNVIKQVEARAKARGVELIATQF